MNVPALSYCKLVFPADAVTAENCVKSTPPLPPVLLSVPITQLFPLYFKTLPTCAPEVLTSVKSFIATDVRKDERLGGVYVNIPVVLSYIRLVAPDASVFTEKLLSDAPELVLSAESA